MAQIAEKTGVSVLSGRVRKALKLETGKKEEKRQQMNIMRLAKQEKKMKGNNV